MTTERRFAVALLTTILALCGAGSAAAATVTVSPLPGTPSAMPRTQISFLGASASALSGISVVGSRSGRHTGALHAYSSATGASFVTKKPFVSGETVTVRARWRDGHSVRNVGTYFRVATPVRPPSLQFPITPGTAADVQSFASAPELHPPKVIVHQPAGPGSAPGYLFAAPFLGPGQYGPMIFDSAGNLVWFHQVPAEQDAADLRTQLYHGKNMLTWWQGRTIILGYGLGKDVIADANYKTVAIVKAGNGVPTDEHEFTILPDGAALITAYEPVQQDLSSVGGPANGTAVDCLVQMIDIHTHLVMWEWHSLGNVALSESYSKPPVNSNGFYDYFHINSVEQLKEGNFLISARNTWGIYALNAHTGHIVWRLGGKKSTFALGEGVQFAYQHHAQMLPGGVVSLFDDEGAPTVKAPSRGEFVKLDFKAKTATLASQLVRTSGPLITNSQGDLQGLPGGGFMVGWGGLPNFTEFNGKGEMIYDGQFPSGEDSYRVYRLPWSGQPATPPALLVSASGGASTAYASWNGATDVASWQLLGGSDAAHLSVISTTPRSGFETAIGLGSGCPWGAMCPTLKANLFEVRALSASGRVLGTSKAVSASG